MYHIGKLGLIAGLLLVSATQTTSALAQTQSTLSTARETAKQGLKDYDAGRYAEAADRLERAFQVVQVPTLAVSCARSLAKIGRPLKAAEMYMAAISLTPQKDWTAVQTEMQKTAAEEREQILARIPRLTIEVRGAKPEDVRVTVDGADVPSALLPDPQMVEPGTREVVGRRGEEEVKVTVELAEGEQKTASLAFVETAAALPPVAPPVTPPVAPPPAQDSSKPGKTQRMAGYISLGVGGAGLLFGGITGIITMQKNSSLEDDGCDGADCFDDQQSDIDSFNTFRTLSTVGFIVGAVGTAAGATLLLTAPKSDGPKVSLMVGPGAAALGGRF